MFTSNSVSANTSFPSFPMAFYGTATINGENLEKDSKVQAYCNSDLIGEVKLTENGIYGYENASKSKLLASECTGDILFKYIPKNLNTALIGAELNKYIEAFESGKVVNKNLNFTTKRTCSVTNGTGSQNWENDNNWGQCLVISCNANYTKNGNSCTAVQSSGGGGGGGGGSVYIAPVIITTNTVNPIIENKTEENKITITEKKSIPGCDTRTTGFSILTGESCLNNKVDLLTQVDQGKVLGVETQNTSFKLTLLLKRGSRNNEVKELQIKLTTLGYDVGKPDGIFGAKTQKAIVDFQKKNKLKADGIVGKNTRDILNK
ncbi:MAG: peptidoglycan-binding domain-containing protein [Candidatus Paceibacterota bacterium]